MDTKHKNIIKSNRGAAAILITMMVLAFMASITFVVARLMVREIRISRDIASSFKAYEMAATGLERASYQLKNDPGGGAFTINPGGSESYIVTYDGTDIINSKGSYSDAERHLEVDYN